MPSERQLRCGVFRGTRDVEQAIERYLARHNEDPKPFIWTKSSDEILQPSPGPANESITQDTSYDPSNRPTQG